MIEAVEERQKRETDVGGRYVLGHLLPGSYVVQTAGLEPFLHFVRPYQYEVFREKPCDSNCIEIGDPVAVQLNQATQNIDFTVQLWGSISGTVTDDLTGAPIPHAKVQVWRAGALSATTANADVTGSYTVWGLRPGDHYITVDASPVYVRGLYDGLPCYDCDPTTGTPVAVAMATTVEQVHVTLAPAVIFTDGFESGDTTAWSGL